MSRIPNSAIPHAWAEDSEHANEVREARARKSSEGRAVLTYAAVAGLAALGLGILFRRWRHA